MDIKYKGIEHERTEDAPFIGALIIAPTCKFKCKGCFNRHLLTQKDLISNANNIINEVKKNPFNEGIILGGLEWSESPIELLELCKVASENNLKVMIYTGCIDLQMFHARLGEACAKKCGEEIITTDAWEYLRYVYIGMQMLDEYIKDDYYIKVGKYEADKTVQERVHFGVSLSTDNQNVIKIKKAK